MGGRWQAQEDLVDHPSGASALPRGFALVREVAIGGARVRTGARREAGRGPRPAVAVVARGVPSLRAVRHGRRKDRGDHQHDEQERDGSGDLHLERAAAGSARRGGAGVRERPDVQRQAALPAVHAQAALRHLRRQRVRPGGPVRAARRVDLPRPDRGGSTGGAQLGETGGGRPGLPAARGGRATAAGPGPQARNPGPARPGPSPTVPERGDAVRGRVAADPARRAAQHRAERHHLRAGRARDRAASGGQGAPARHRPGTARGR